MSLSSSNPSPDGFQPYQLLATDSATSARVGVLRTPHGDIPTPAFMPVGTQGTVKGVSPDELKALDAPVVLGNTYHLSVRPGAELIAEAGGLHKFMGWDRAILTDSGGFQVFSLAKLRKLTEKGVTFQNHVDGSPCELTPENVMETQRHLGSDIAMVLDECPPHGCSREYAANSLALTHRWAARAREWLCANPPQRDSSGRHPMVFAITQGSVFADLRRESAEYLGSLDFDGYAVGGVSVGETEEEMMFAVESAAPFLPTDKARYAMGLGTPPQLLKLVARGIDMFDCVLPTRVARNGTAFTNQGTLHLRNARHTRAFAPIEEGCECYACRNFTRAYVRHLLKTEELLGLRLVTLHNLHFYLNLMRRARCAILEGGYREFHDQFLAGYSGSEE